MADTWYSSIPSFPGAFPPSRKSHTRGLAKEFGPFAVAVEPDVKTAWLGEQKAQGWKRAYAEMRAKYTVLLPAPPDKEAAKASAPAPREEIPASSGASPQ